MILVNQHEIASYWWVTFFSFFCLIDFADTFPYPAPTHTIPSLSLSHNFPSISVSYSHLLVFSCFFFSLFFLGLEPKLIDLETTVFSDNNSGHLRLDTVVNSCLNFSIKFVHLPVSLSRLLPLPYPVPVRSLSLSLPLLPSISCPFPFPTLSLPISYPVPFPPLPSPVPVPLTSLVLKQI